MPQHDAQVPHRHHAGPVAGRPRGRRLPVDALRSARAERRGLDLALRSPLVPGPRPRGDDDARRDRRAHDAAQVRAERGRPALPHPGRRGQGDGHGRLAVAGPPLPRGRRGRGAAARVRGLRRAVRGARPPHRRGHPRAAPAVDAGRGDLPRPLLQARSHLGLPQAVADAAAHLDRRQERGGHAPHRPAGRRLDSLLHHARGAARRASRRCRSSRRRRAVRCPRITSAP